MQKEGPSVARFLDYHKLEIFLGGVLLVAFLIILFVLFFGGFDPKINQLRQMKHELDFSYQVDQAKAFCQQKCGTAVANACEPVYVAQYCLSYVKDNMDANFNSKVDYAVINGVGSCEDRVYCSNLVSCECPGSGTMKDCFQSLCGFWTKEAVSDPTKALTDNIVPGSCDYSSEPDHWYNKDRYLMSCASY